MECSSVFIFFVSGDMHTKHSSELKPTICILMYSLGKSSFCFLAKLFNISPSTTYQWLCKTAETIEEPTVSNEIKEIEIDEMWHILTSRKSKSGSSKPWIVTQGELSPGLSVVVMLQRSENYIASSNT